MAGVFSRVFTCHVRNTFVPPLPQVKASRLFHGFSYGTRKILNKPQNFGINLIRKTETLAVHAIASKNAVAQKAVGYWLLGCGGMVFGAVVLGGVTRLTESGLSMVTWKLFGEKPPFNQADWEKEFELYKQFPEYKMKNMDITLEEFKRIWWMEYSHRMWGRCIGAAFLLPATYFWMKGYFTSAMKKRVPVFGLLIAAQGLMGWYMVKSGLEDRFPTQNDVVRVSQYRLASHLSIAFILYTGFLWSAFDHLIPAQKLAEVTKSARRFRGLAHASKGLVFLTAFSGAFVAGLDAGLVYNSFPKMGDKWIPDEILAFTPKISNITENPVTVQFDHRILGITTLSVISGLWLLSRKRTLPPRAYKAANALAIMAWTQVLLGITALVHYVPVSLAALHQSGSLVLLSFAVWLTHELKYVKRVVK
ncbi:heme A synthase COX15 [Halyomorpha halys]|uniref:heme A synthase COX15 n=1 Tax=Halyomorpha halys TaxID=286706 RepID=UPI0006D4FD13|nr:cytochrome c oxidase assembly protein COX15 homolog [Halyomorpha halys]